MTRILHLGLGLLHPKLDACSEELHRVLWPHSIQDACVTQRLQGIMCHLHTILWREVLVTGWACRVLDLRVVLVLHAKRVIARRHDEGLTHLPPAHVTLKRRPRHDAQERR